MTLTELTNFQSSVNLVNEKILHLSPTAVRTHVPLKTAVSTVRSGQLYQLTQILFDEGSQRSFVTEDLTRKVNSRSDGTDVLQLSPFGNGNKLYDTEKSTKIDAGERIPIIVQIVPMIIISE